MRTLIFLHVTFIGTPGTSHNYEFGWDDHNSKHVKSVLISKYFILMINKTVKNEWMVN